MSDYDFSREQAEAIIKVIQSVRTPRKKPGRKIQKFQRITLEPEDATWISSLLYEECNRGLVEVRIHATPGPHSIEMAFAMTIVGAVSSTIANRLIGKLEKKVREYFSKKAQKKQKRVKSKRVQKKRRAKESSD
jgi:hypothetical protein